MAVFGASGLIEGGPVSTQNWQMATVPAGAYVSKIDIQGIVALKGFSGGLTAGLYQTYNLAAGVQYGNSGYTVHSISDGTAGGANWIAYGMLLEQTGANTYVPGLSPQNFTQALALPITLAWRQLWRAAVATDIYLCVGCNTSRGDAPVYQLECSYNVEWATFP